MNNMLLFGMRVTIGVCESLGSLGRSWKVLECGDFWVWGPLSWSGWCSRCWDWNDSQIFNAHSLFRWCTDLAWCSCIFSLGPAKQFLHDSVRPCCWPGMTDWIIWTLYWVIEQKPFAHETKCFGKAKEFSSKLQENLGLALVHVVFCPYVLASLASHTLPVYNLYTKMHSGSILEREHFHQVSSVFQWREAHGHAMGCPAREKTVCVVPWDWTRLNQLQFQVPKIQTTNINKACVRAMSGDMPPKWGRLYMVQYLYFRVLKFPLNDWFVQPLRFFSLGPG